MNLTKSLDPTRAVTFVTSQAADKDQAVSSQCGQEVKNIYAETTHDIYVLLQKRVWEIEEIYQFYETFKTRLILIKHL